MLSDDKDSELKAAVDARSHDLIKEFERHFQQIIDVEPAAKNRRDHVFQAWAIQKIAGLQLSVEEIAMKSNGHLGAQDDLN